MNDCSSISLATPVPSATPGAQTTAIVPTATAGGDATPTGTAVPATPEPAAVRAAALSIPSISREGNPALVDQLSGPETPTGLPNTSGWSEANTVLIVVVVLAIFVAVVGLLLRRRAHP